MARKNIILSVAGVALVLFLSQIEGIIGAFRAEELLENGFSANLILSALSSDWMTLALPILCAIPCTASFVEEIKSGFIKEYLPRTTIKQYICDKIGACAVSGGVVLGTGILLAYGLSMLVFSPLEGPLEEGMAAEPYLAMLLSRAALFSLSGGFWALTGMTFAALTGSKYMAYASPFILYYVLIILNERYFNDLYILYPKEWLNPSDFWVMGSWGAAIWVIELSALMALAFGQVARRKIQSI